MSTAVFAFAAVLIAGSVLGFAAHAKPIERKLQRCMVYLPDMKDAKLRRWCLAQSRRMP